MRTRLLAGAVTTAATTLLLASPALAQEDAPTVESVSELANQVNIDLNTIFIFICGCLVFFMGAGFALVETGLTRSRSAAHMMMKNLITAAIGVVAFWAVGFAIAYGDGNDIIGWSGWFLTGTYGENFNSLAGYGAVDLAAMWFFQAAFAATAATIISGAMAERTKLIPYIVISVIVSGVIYPVVVHWHWGGGWLYQLGFKDYAGSTLVHMTGGVAALVGVWLLGPRIGRYRNGKVFPIPAHNIPFAVIGTFVLWFGWFGFNVGSWLGSSPGASVALAIVPTALGGAVGGLVAMSVTWIQTGKPDVSMTANGVLAGLVGVTAGAGFIDPWAAAIVAGIAGLIVVFAVSFFDKIRIDDPVGATSVHGVCGIWGTLAVGLFDRDTGLLTGNGAEQLLDQLIGVVSVAAFVAVASFILFSAVKAIFGLRVTAEEELDGLDMAEHGALGYGSDVYVDHDGAPTAAHRASVLG
jgi:Amt family ammonium transporter